MARLSLQALWDGENGAGRGEEHLAVELVVVVAVELPGVRVSIAPEGIGQVTGPYVQPRKGPEAASGDEAGDGGPPSGAGRPRGAKRPDGAARPRSAVPPMPNS